jgi:hypothetical protein
MFRTKAMQTDLEGNLFEDDFGLVRQGVKAIQRGDFVDEFDRV